MNVSYMSFSLLCPGGRVWGDLQHQADQHLLHDREEQVQLRLLRHGLSLPCRGIPLALTPFFPLKSLIYEIS
jgi:hypothetical protein